MAAFRDCTKGALGIATIGDQVGPYLSTYDAGWYGAGRNQRTVGHQALLRGAADAVMPLDVNGQPSPTGLIGVVGIGSSGAKLIWNQLVPQVLGSQQQARDGLTLANLCEDGIDTAKWANPAHWVWTSKVPAELLSAGLDANQVQVAWVQAGASSVTQGFPAHVQALQADLLKVVQNAKAAFPNLRIVYLDSTFPMHYLAGVATLEPTFFEQGFAVRELILQQLAGDPLLDCFHQPAVAPVLDWGGKFWTDGPRGDSRGHFWLCPADVKLDGHHPTLSGATKLATLLLDRWTNDGIACRWLFEAPEAGGAGDPVPPTMEAGA